MDLIHHLSPRNIFEFIREYFGASSEKNLMVSSTIIHCDLIIYILQRFVQCPMKQNMLRHVHPTLPI
jgi:hypothetical protein